jgi:hypothetical protein
MIYAALLMLMIAGYSTIPLAKENDATDKVVNTDTLYYVGCYIEASGEIDFTWQLNDIPIVFRYRYISYWPIVFNEPNVDVTIYSRKNGDILWVDSFESGQWILYLVNFIGEYNNDGSTSEKLIVNLDGRAAFVMISTEGNDNYDVKNQVHHESNCGSPLINTVSRYKNCYLEISGYMHDDWPAFVKLPNMVQKLWAYEPNTVKVLFGVYPYIVFEEDVSIQLFDKKDRTLL